MERWQKREDAQRCIGSRPIWSGMVPPVPVWWLGGHAVGAVGPEVHGDSGDHGYAPHDFRCSSDSIKEG